MPKDKYKELEKSVCATCGNEHVEGLYWIEINTKKVVETYTGSVSNRYYCSKCGFTTLMTKEDFNNFKSKEK